MKRTLVMPQGVADTAENLMARMRRADECLEGARWILEREAERGKRIWAEPPVYALEMEDTAARERVSFFYTIAQDKVLLLSLSASAAPSVL